MDELDKRMLAYMRQQEAPPLVSTASLQNRLAERRQRRSQALQLILGCVLAAMSLLLSLVMLGLARRVLPPAALYMLSALLGGIPLALLMGGAVIWQLYPGREGILYDNDGKEG